MQLDLACGTMLYLGVTCLVAGTVAATVPTKGVTFCCDKFAVQKEVLKEAAATMAAVGMRALSMIVTVLTTHLSPLHDYRFV